MKKKNCLVIICILFIILILSLTGCYDSRGVEELAYITAIGLDLSDSDNLLLSLQISIPSSSGSPDSGSSQSSKTDTISVECETINSGLSLINSRISKEVDLSHCKAVVISEKIASRGVSEYIETLSNNIELRPNCNVIITRCLAKEFIENASPLIESLTARYYEVALKSSEYTGYIPSTKLIDFISNIDNSTIQANAILGGLSNKETDSSNKKTSNSTGITENNNYKAGNTPTETTDNVEVFGTAVFSRDMLVGELTGFETICHLIISNELKSCTISIPVMFDNYEKTIDLRLKKYKNTKISIDFVNGSPYISVDVFLDGYGVSLDNSIDYSSSENISKINVSAEQFLKHEILNYLYKTSKDFNSDIDGFGKKAIIKYKTIDDWTSSNWLENYKNSFFNVNVHVNIKSGSKFNKSP